MSLHRRESKDLPHRRWSLALTLTLWYAVPMSLLMLGLCAAMYLSAKGALRREADSRLINEVGLLRGIVDAAGNDLPGLAKELADEVEESEATGRHQTFHAGGRVFILRVLDARGSTVVERSSMSGRIGAGALPVLSESDELLPQDLTLPGGLTFRVATASAGPDASKYTLQIATETHLEQTLLSRYGKQLVLTLGVGLLLCSATSYLMARLAVRPVIRMATEASQIGVKNLNAHLSDDDLPYELSLLAASFNQMLEQLNDSFLRMSRFSGDIAHELRTPIAIIRGEIEVTLLRARTDSEYRTTLASSLEEIARLQRLIDQLLFLARADNNEAFVKTERLDLVAEAGTVAEFYDVVAHTRGIELVSIASADVVVAMDKSLYQSAVANLVENAIAHTPSGGRVTIRTGCDAENAIIEVQDNGSGIPPEHLAHVRDRLYQVDPARSRGSGHVGLGLSLVQKIIELHRGQFRIESELGRGTTATLILPLGPSPGAAEATTS